MRQTNEAVIQAFAHVARPVILGYFSRRSCIASSRIAIECLKEFHIRSVAEPVRFSLALPDRSCMYLAGGSPAELDSLRNSAHKHVALPAGDGGGWPGHLIVRCGNCLIDPSFDQALEALSGEAGIWHGPLIGVFPFSSSLPKRFGVEARAELNDGTHIEVRYDSRLDRSYAAQPAWETDHLQWAILEILGKMKDALKEQAG
jgi:hypothetical protein